MAECPFCKTTIDDELARFGGHCPKCVIEIPGDETPTDPGIGKRVEEQVETERKRGWGVYLGVGGLAALVLLSSGAVLWWKVQQQHEADRIAQLEAEADGDFYLAPAEAHELPIASNDESSSTSPGSGSRTQGHDSARQVTTIAATGGGGSAGGSNRFDFIGSSGADEPELADLHERKLDVSPGNTDLGTVGLSVPKIDIQRGGVGSVALSDPDEIRRSVGSALKSYSKQMTACYERRLKNTAELAGTWDAAFTILENGRTAGILVAARERGDAELERCMQNAIAGWKFQTMVGSQRIEKPYSFGPSE